MAWTGSPSSRNTQDLVPKLSPRGPEVRNWFRTEPLGIPRNGWSCVSCWPLELGMCKIYNTYQYISIPTSILYSDVFKQTRLHMIHVDSLVVCLAFGSRQSFCESNRSTTSRSVCCKVRHLKHWLGPFPENSLVKKPFRALSLLVKKSLETE